MNLCSERAVCSHFWSLVDIFSSNVNEVIEQFQTFLFFYEKILHAQKAEKVQKCNQAQKAHKKHKNANKRISDSPPADVFYPHKNAALFLFAYMRFVLFALAKYFRKKK